MEWERWAIPSFTAASARPIGSAASTMILPTRSQRTVAAFCPIGSGSHQQHPHWDQSPLEWVEHQADAFQRRCAQQRLIASFAKNHGSSAALPLVFEIRIAHAARYGPPVSQRKIHGAVRTDTQLLER